MKPLVPVAVVTLALLAGASGHASLLELLPEVLPVAPVCGSTLDTAFRGDDAHSRPFLQRACESQRLAAALYQPSPSRAPVAMPSRHLQPHTFTLEDDSDEEAPQVSEPAGTPEFVYELAGWLAPMQMAIPDDLCREQSRAYLDQLSMVRPWALQMFDASGKMPDGFFYGNTNMLGSWDECLKVRAKLNDTEYPNITQAAFTGQYCLAQIISKSRLSSRQQQASGTPGLDVVPILPLPGLSSLAFGPMPLRYGYCIPSSCSEQDVTISLNIWLNMLNQSDLVAYVGTGDCHTADEPTVFENNDIAVIVVMAVFGAIIMLCTTLDVIGMYMSRRQSEAANTIIDQPTAAFPPAKWRLVTAFSLRYNGRKLFSTRTGSDNLGCIHGMRFLSMTWVVLGHNYLFAWYNAAWVNTLYITEMIKAPAIEVVLNALLSVDSFFCLGGIMIGYSFMKTVAANGGKVLWHDIPMMYLHRYLRLTPVYAIVVGLTATLGRRIGTAPGLSSVMDREAQSCQTNWWRNLLYINNFGDIQNLCVVQSWYLPVDFQLFLVAPFMMLPYVYNKKLGAAWLGLITAASVAIPAIITYQNDLPPTFLPFNVHMDTGKFFADLYEMPWCRASPYVVGICTGMLLHHIKSNKITIRIPMALNVLTWGVMSVVGLLVVYGTHHWSKDPQAAWTTAQAVSYGSLHRLAWGVALCWVVFACVTGHGGFVDTLLSFGGFIPLGRLTYPTYLIAIQIQQWYFSSYKAAATYDNTMAVYTFLSNLAVSLTIAAILSLSFESPMMTIEKIIFPQRSRKHSPKSKPELLGTTHEAVTRM